MPIPPASRTPRLLLRNGSPIILADASVSVAAASDESTDDTRFTALGYRQTLVSAAKGGKANQNGFRFRNGGMRAMARTFRNNAFVGGHDWGDPRARGGTIEDAYAEEMPGDVEMAIYFHILLQAAWAIEGKKNGTIDRFSIGASGQGEAMCTVHNVPLWSISECWCWPGETVVGEDGTSVVAEVEWEGGIGLELSAVNVPAVDGTGIVENSWASNRIEFAADRATELKMLELAVGRTKPWDRRPTARVSAAVPEGVSTPAPAPITITSTPCDSTASRSNQMDRTLLCQSLGLPVNATDEQIAAKIKATTTAAAQSDVLRAQLDDVSAARAAEQDAAHVDATITKLRSTHQVSDKVVASLRKVALEHGRGSFDTNVANVEESAPALPATRPVLQSDVRATETPGPGITTGGGSLDVVVMTQGNEFIAPIMRMCRVTEAQVREHGSSTFNVVPKLKELIDNTHARGDRMGTGR